MSIVNDKGGVYLEADGEKAEISLESGWFAETATLTVVVGQTTVTVELTRKELKALKRDIKELLSDDNYTF